MAKQEAAKSSLTGMLNMGMKVVNKAVGEGETQINFERNALRVSIHISHLRHFSEIRFYISILSVKQTLKIDQFLKNFITFGVVN